MKSHSMSLLISILFLASSAVEAMEQPLTKSKTIDPIYAQKVLLKNKLGYYLYTNEYGDEDIDDRVSMANNLNKIKQQYPSFLNEQVPHEDNYTFAELMDDIANRYRLSKQPKGYRALPIRQSAPRRK